MKWKEMKTRSPTHAAVRREVLIANWSSVQFICREEATTGREAVLRQTRVSKRNHVLVGRHWRQLANTTDRSVHGGSAALCQIS